MERLASVYLAGRLQASAAFKSDTICSYTSATVDRGVKLLSGKLWRFIGLSLIHILKDQTVTLPEPPSFPKSSTADHLDYIELSRRACLLYTSEMYAQSGAQGGAQAGPGAGQQANQGSSNNKEDIQDADFEEVK